MFLNYNVDCQLGLIISIIVSFVLHTFRELYIIVKLYPQKLSESNPIYLNCFFIG